MRTPWHLWVVGIAALIWNGFGAFDYVATQYEIEAYMGQFSAEERAWFDAFPTWVVASWAIAVWSAVAASLALLMRSGAAAVLFGIALIFFLITAVHNFVFAEPSMLDQMGTEAIWISLAIFVVTLLSWLYARTMRMRGVLG